MPDSCRLAMIERRSIVQFGSGELLCLGPNRNRIFVIALVVAAVAVVGMSRLRVESSLKNYFSADLPVGVGTLLARTHSPCQNVDLGVAVAPLIVIAIPDVFLLQNHSPAQRPGMRVLRRTGA